MEPAAQRLRHADLVCVTSAAGSRRRLLRLQLSDGAPGAETSYVCRKTVETLLLGATPKAFENAVNRTPVDGPESVLVATPDELALLKAAGVVSPAASATSSVQLFSVAYAVEVLVGALARCDVVESLRAAAEQPRGAAVSGPEAARLLAAPVSRVVRMPPALPKASGEPAAAQYALNESQLTTAPLVHELEALAAFLTAQIQLDRAGAGPVSPTTVANTRISVARVLGYAHGVASRPPPHTLNLLLDGGVLAGFAGYCLEVRRNKPASVATELAGIQRVLSYLATAAPPEERAELAELQASLRRLCRQLAAMHQDAAPTAAELSRAEQYADLAAIWGFCDSLYDALDFADRSREAARRIHDALMAFLCLRENPITRPACMWLIKRPGASSPCDVPGCTKPGCRGNAWRSAFVLDIVHFKTAKSHKLHTIRVPEGSRTAKLLAAYSGWARELLLANGVVSDSLWLGSAGKPFTSARGFAQYLPRILSRCASVTWTRLRHIVATGIVPLATEQELNSLAVAMQTSTAKLKEVYQDKEAVAALGAELYRSLAPRGGDKRPAAEGGAQPPAAQRCRMEAGEEQAGSAAKVELVIGGVSVTITVSPTVLAGGVV